MNQNMKELILFLIISIKNIFIAIIFTTVFGFYNTVVFNTMTFTYGDITWEAIIFLVLCLIDCIIYNFLKKK